MLNRICQQIIEKKIHITPYFHYLQFKKYIFEIHSPQNLSSFIDLSNSIAQIKMKKYEIT